MCISEGCIFSLTGSQQVLWSVDCSAYWQAEAGATLAAGKRRRKERVQTPAPTAVSPGAARKAVVSGLHEECEEVAPKDKSLGSGLPSPAAPAQPASCPPVALPVASPARSCEAQAGLQTCYGLQKYWVMVAV